MTDELRHEITKLEGKVNVLELRAPKDPGVIPVLESDVRALKEQYRSLDTKVDKILDKLNSLSIKVAGATALSTALTTGIISYYVQH